MTSRGKPAWSVMALLILALLPLLGGCAIVSVGSAGVSLGATAVKTTGKAAGAAVDVTGSTVRAVVPDGGDGDSGDP